MHHMIAERIMGLINANTGLGNLSSQDYSKIKDLLLSKKNHPYFYLGCQGPDFLFFHSPDWPAGAETLAQTYVDITEFLIDLEKKILSVVPQPVLDALAAASALGDEVVQASSTLTEVSQLFGDLNQLLQGILSAVQLKTADWITNDLNPYEDLLTHPYRDGLKNADPEDWWYFDAMHYRKTGKFSKILLDATSSLSSPAHLYAIGYLSHVTADTVGHSYVNIISGGPYRSHAQRHKVGENLQDVFNYNLATPAAQKDLNISQLHALYNFNYDGNLNALGASEAIPDPDSRMPDDLANLIADSINKVYGVNEDGPPDTRMDFGAPVTSEQIKTTYKLWYKWWRNTTETGQLPQPVPYSFSGELREVWETATNNLGNIGDFISDAADDVSNGGILSLFAFLGALIVGAIAAALALADAVIGALTTLSVAAIRAAACLIYEHVFNAYQLLRLSLALKGLSFPMVEHLNEPVLQQFKDPSQTDVQGANALQQKLIYPLLRWTGQENTDFAEKHLQYAPVRNTPGLPPNHGESPTTQAPPDSYFMNFSTHYAWGDLPLDKELIDELAILGSTAAANVINASGSPSTHAAETHALLQSHNLQLGNALELNAEMSHRIRNNLPIPDFNLDSDRGFGYLCWVQNSDPVNTPAQIAVEPDSPETPATVEAAHGASVHLRYIN
jgi:hypothetical protein